MVKQPAVKPKAVIKALKRAGFYIHHQVGSHARLKHSTELHRRVTIPIHNKEIPKGTLSNILRQAGLTLEEFIDLL